MHPVVLKAILAITIGGGVGFIIIRFFLRKSILFNIAWLWLINLLFVNINTRMMETFTDTYPYALGFFLNILVSAVMVTLVFKMIKKPFAKVASDVEKLAHGKLNIEVDEKLNSADDELGLLHRSVLKLSGQLIHTHHNLKNISGRINQIGYNLNTTSSELTSSSTNQASSLEEVSASMEEMAANIQMNSENSGKTGEIAKHANEAVIQGNKSAVTALESMKEIAGHIKIINDIAFQTNILALNAAVEAARAGEQGKGFAVVATEVRKLAVQSKSAADQIVERATHGSTISQAAIDKLNSTLPLIQETTNLVQDIYIASQEQSNGAMQINSSIQSMNNETQKNVYTAEKIAKSSQQMLQEAKQLLESINFFRVNE